MSTKIKIVGNILNIAQLIPTYAKVSKKSSDQKLILKFLSKWNYIFYMNCCYTFPIFQNCFSYYNKIWINTEQSTPCVLYLWIEISRLTFDYTKEPQRKFPIPGDIL